MQHQPSFCNDSSRCFATHERTRIVGSARGRHRRRFPAGTARPRRAAGVPARQTAHPGRPRHAHRTGPPPRDRLVQAAGVPRCPRSRRLAHLGEQWVFHRRECPDHAPRPRRAELLSVARASPAILRPAVTALAVGNVGKQRDAATGRHTEAGHDAGDCCGAHAKPRSHVTSRIAWSKLMPRVGEEFPLQGPACGGDIRLRGDGRQEPAHAK